jgi:hypothetical protein
MKETSTDVLDAKLALEQELIRPLTMACANYVAKWQQTEGRPSQWDRGACRDQVEKVLLRHYGRVAMVMSGRNPGKNPTLEEAALSLHHMESMRDRARNQSMHILAGIDRDLGASMAILADNTEQKAEGDKKPVFTVTAGYIGRIHASASRALRNLGSRMGLISNVQTESAAEETRKEVAQNLAANVGKDAAEREKPAFDLVEHQSDASGPIMKRWLSLMDGRERDTHHEAHNAYAGTANAIPVTQPYVVGGAQLMFPGDTSLGAPLREIVNCRCMSHYFILLPDGTERPLYTSPSAPARRQRRAGDRIGPNGRLPYKPTSSVRLNGKTRAKVVLGDGTLANLNQITPNTVQVVQNGKVIGRATISGGKVVGKVTVAPGSATRDIEGLIRRSVAVSP